MDQKKPYLVVLLIQSIYVGMFLLSKAAFNDGMKSCVFVFYRQAAATLFLAPLAVYFEWITLSMNFYGIGLIYGSATLAVAIWQSLPVITFFAALLPRMETLKVRTVAEIGKLVGIILCMSGASTLAFYEGPHFKSFCIHHFFNHATKEHHHFEHIALLPHRG